MSDRTDDGWIDGWTEEEWEAFHNVPCPDVEETVIDVTFTCPPVRYDFLRLTDNVLETWQRRPDGSYVYTVSQPPSEDQQSAMHSALLGVPEGEQGVRLPPGNQG